MTEHLIKVLKGEEMLTNEDKAFLFGYMNEANSWAKDHSENIDTKKFRSTMASDGVVLDDDQERVLSIIDELKDK